MGLNAYEYQCGRGVRINREGVLKLKAGCEARDIQLSLHAPYYISLPGVEKSVRTASSTFWNPPKPPDLMGASRACGPFRLLCQDSREEALSLAGET